MGIKVTKFGGTSVADAIQLAKLRDIVYKDSERRFVVVSAPGKRFDGDSKITDILYLCKSHMENNLPYEQLFQVVADRYMALEVSLGIDVNIKNEIEVIRETLKTNPTKEYIASRGEYLNALLIAGYLGFDFVDAKDLVKFDNKGRFLLEDTVSALASELKNHDKAVIPGFYGSLPNGEIMTFSRGGSDITGALVACAVKADVYENWTDVSGFLMADPRIVKNARPIRKISYRELRELSYMGASVLHEDAIYPARLANIPINIRNTNAVDDPGTVITADSYGTDDGKIITGIAGTKDFMVISIQKNRMNAERGFLRNVIGVLDDYGITLEHIPSGIDSMSLVVSNKEVNGRTEELVEELKARLKPDSIDCYEDVALIATVGHGMSRRTGVSGTLFKALADANVNIRMIDQGSSEMNIIIGVENKDFEKAIRAIYEAFEG